MEETSRPVHAILLAAGESKRCQSNKLFFSWGNRTVIEQVVDHLLNSRVSDTVVILGHQADKVAALLEGKSCRLTVNPDYRKGMGTSVCRGIRYWLEDPEFALDAGFLLALGDEPFISSEVINQVVEGYQLARRSIVVPVFQGRCGHPPIFHRKHAPELLDVASRFGAREIIHRHPDDLLKLPIDTDSILLDIDTPDDYRKLVKKFASELK